MSSRKATLKKLRLPGAGSSDSRNGRRKAPPTISNFFSPEPETAELANDVRTIEFSQPMPSPIEKPEEEEENKPKRATRTKLSTFLSKKKRLKPAVEEPISEFLMKGKLDDFEAPNKNVKKAPETKAKPRPKRQQNIKTAFLKREELFSAVTAQHCLVDNINPDEMQMALALSRSEADVNGTILVDDDDEDKSKEGKGDIRETLKKFGFRTAEAKDYHLTAFLPTNKRTKWGNKFTALTLRNPKRQMEKVNQKIEDFLSTQFISSDSTHVDESCCYSIKSSILLPLLADDHIIIRSEACVSDVVDFYVLSLFEPSRTKAGHLLKDVCHIPGRDRSPMRRVPLMKEEDMDCLLQSPAMKKSRYDEMLSHPSKIQGLPVKPLALTISSLSDFDPEIVNSPTSSRKTLPVSDLVDSATRPDDCDLPNVNGPEINFDLADNTSKDPNLSTRISQTSTSETTPKSQISNEGCLRSQLQLSSIRTSSPDIFADSDVEMETDDCSEMKKLNDTKSSSNGLHITTFEIFSSDEVKTFSETKNDSYDVDNNFLTAVIDLTQCGSAANSLNFDEIAPSMSIESYQDNCLTEEIPDILKFEEITSTSLKPRTESDCLFSLNGSYSLEKSTESKRTCFSFGGSASEDLKKSMSFTKSSPMKAEDSIDLTQNSNGDEECILLSDDEVNYSIWKADKSVHVKEEENIDGQNLSMDHLLNGEKVNLEFSFVDLVACTQQLTEFELSAKTKSNSSFDSLDLELSKRSDFGILEENSPFKTPTKTPKKTPRKTPFSATAKCRRTLSESFLGSPVESTAPLKHFSSTKKFYEFTKSDDDSLSDLDDIDKLIYGSPSKKAYKKPAGLDKLLTGAFSTKIDSPKKKEAEPLKEFDFNGRTYLVRTKNFFQKPNFETMDESAVLDQLYKYGIKPLKRKQAVKLLEYVYNQTHPCLVDESESPSQTVTTIGDDDEDGEGIPATNDSKFNFKDCWGHVLVSEGDVSMEIEDEQYIVQTNTSKKISTALLPFHIAWYNLVKSNKLLHEAILHYEPIDLQEVYLFFKTLGYRYDPKELKYFFDSRSIIFRYDLNKSDPSAGANRHIKKKRPNLSQRSGKNKIS